MLSLSVHPHVCGELQVYPHVYSNDLRFIPTCVGNSFTFATLPAGISVHPHVCGELVFTMHFLVLSNGSSPRVWGTLQIIHPLGLLLRFIPTCVGNSQHLQILPMRYTVHPHVCGELIVDVSASTVLIGSSPRVWGTQRLCKNDFRYKRFIPTCVGNSLYYLYD